MNAFKAYMKKEWVEQLRLGHVVILAILFVLFGIMNPAIAKLTPWMMNLFSDSLASNGMTVTQVEVTALTSWGQFYKNIPVAMIVFVLLQGNVVTGECQKGTLIPILTKGLARYKVMVGKTIMLILLWTCGFVLCYGITYAYNAYFWDNSVALNLNAAAMAWYFFGIWMISLMMLFSSFSASMTGVLLGTGGVTIVVYLLSMISRMKPYTPMVLTESMELLNGSKDITDLRVSVLVTAMAVLANVGISVFLFNKRNICR